MGDNKSGQHSDEIPPFKKTYVGGQETSDDGGLGRND